MIICKVDSLQIYTGEVASIPDSDPVPTGWIATEKPDGPEPYQQWRSTYWHGLDEYPVPPVPVPVEPRYSPTKIIRAVDSMGQAGNLEKMLATAEPRVRLLWQKETEFAGDDVDFVRLVRDCQQAWQLTDEQMRELLSNCTV